MLSTLRQTNPFETGDSETQASLQILEFLWSLALVTLECPRKTSKENYLSKFIYAIEPMTLLKWP